MATIKKRGNSYLIRCYDGYDQAGRQIERTMTWKIPAGMTEKKAEKEARHQAELFEEKVRTGQSAEQKAMKFAAFAEKWFQDYAAMQLRPRTIDGYKHLMQRVYPSIGHLYIDKIRPAHLVQFYRELSETKKATTYRFNGDLKQLLKASGLNMTSFSKKAGVPLSAVKSSANGNNINIQNASLIASGLNKTVNELFTASNSEEMLSPNTVGKYHRVLRHTNATLQIANGSSVTTVAGYLGHANAGTTTKVYAHAIQSAQAAAAELLEDILTPSKQKAARKA